MTYIKNNVKYNLGDKVTINMPFSSETFNQSIDIPTTVYIHGIKTSQIGIIRYALQVSYQVGKDENYTGNDVWIAEKDILGIALEDEKIEKEGNYND